jgi:predicted NBD/HSP70 family sugar kinase
LIRYVHEFPDITRQELAQRLGQSPAAISLVIRRLINSGWLRESGRAVSLGGRRPVQLRLSAQKALIVGQAVTNDGIRTVVVNPDGEMLAQHHTSELPPGNGLADEMKAGIDAAVEMAGISKEQIIGAGVALSGIVYSDSGIARNYPNSDNVPERNFLDLLEKMFDDKVIAIDHVTRARLIWDVYQNPALREQTCLLLELGSELGGALSVFGTLYRGSDGAPLDVRNLLVSPNGRGGAKTARLEEIVALERLTANTRRALEHCGPCLLLDMLGGDLDALTPGLIARAAQAGDTLAFRIVSDVSEAVGDAISTIGGLLRPRTVLVAGQLVTSGLLNLDVVRRTVRLGVDPDVYDNMRLTVSESEEWGAANGVAHLVLRKWLDGLAPAKDGLLTEA